MLTKKQLKQLRNEITLNSLYLNDYNNSLFIKEKTACNFFEGYIEYLYEIANNETLDVFDLIDKYDNVDNLYNYYIGFDDDPLLQDDFIAYKHINNSDSIVIYKIDDYILYPTIKTAFMCLHGLYYENTKIKEYKLYESIKNGYYFKINNTRYYINDFVRV